MRRSRRSRRGLVGVEGARLDATLAQHADAGLAGAPASTILVAHEPRLGMADAALVDNDDGTPAPQLGQSVEQIGHRRIEDAARPARHDDDGIGFRIGREAREDRKEHLDRRMRRELPLMRIARLRHEQREAALRGRRIGPRTRGRFDARHRQWRRGILAARRCGEAHDEAGDEGRDHAHGFIVRALAIFRLTYRRASVRRRRCGERDRAPDKR